MIIEVRNVSKEFTIERGIFKSQGSRMFALNSVSFSVQEFSTLGIVGESGSGKTTLAKIILGLIPPTTGEVIFNEAYIRNFRKDLQIIFQNPYNSLDPKMRIAEAIFEPLAIHRIVAKEKFRDRAVELLRTVGLDETALTRYPREFSGGQRQRICIARALACEPKVLVLDEPISSLDLTIQAKLLDLFIQLKQQLHLTYVLISHNLAVIKYIADSVLVMKDGRAVEYGKVNEIFSQPKHSYTRTLISVGC